MIKQGLSNYFKSLKYFFTPLGTMFLGIMLGISVFIPGVISATTTLVDNIKTLSQNVNLDFSVLLNNIWASVEALDWSNPIEAIQAMLSIEWLNKTLTQSLSAILGTDFETFKMQIAEYVQLFLQAVSANVVVFFVFWILGFIAGYWLIRFLIRRNIARRSLWKFVLAYLLNSLITALLIIAMLVIFAAWQYSIIFTAILAFLLVAMIAFVQAYLLYAYKKVKFGQIVNLKNAALYVLTNFIIIVISAGITLIAVTVNALMGVFVGLSIFAIAGIVINLNAESYVIEQVNRVTAASKADSVAVIEADVAELDEIK